MKNAYVLVAHAGDRGRLDEGDVILDLSNARFDDLEKIDLVREATPDEVKSWKPRFLAEANAKPQATTIVVDVADLNALREALKDRNAEIVVLTDARDAADQQLGALRDQVRSLTADLDAAREELRETAARNEKQAAMITSLTEERDRALAAQSSTAEAASEEKAASEPANKQAPASENKAAPSAKNKA